MELRDAMARRRMVRDFDGAAIPAEQLAALCTEALAAPTAGNSRGIELVALDGTLGVSRYLDAATDPDWREASPRAEGFARAGAAVLVVCDPEAYARRYAEPDKRGSGLHETSGWPVPYWYGDAGAVTLSLLLLAVDAGLGACFLGAFRNASRVLRSVGAPADRTLYGCVLLGGASRPQVRGASLRRPGPPRSARVHLGGYDRAPR